MHVHMLPWFEWWSNLAPGGCRRSCRRAPGARRRHRALPPCSRAHRLACPPAALPAAVGIDDGQGILVRSVMEHGLAQRLREHPVWRGVAAGAQLALGGETAEPFGQQRAVAAESEGEEAELAAAAA